MTHDYKRHGTTTLFAALSVLDGTVIGRCMQRHRRLEFIRFLNAVERQVPAGKRSEPFRVCWRLFGLSHAATADGSSIA